MANEYLKATLVTENGGPLDVSEPRIVRVDPASGSAMLIGATHGLTLMLGCMTPLVIGLMFAAQLACDLPPWPVGNYELTLLVWTALWLAFLGYSLCCGSYVETYLFNPQQRRLWHLNSGEVLDLKALAELARARQKPADAAVTDASPQERLLPMAAERLLGINWQRLQKLQPYRPSPLRAYLCSFWPVDAWWIAGVTVGTCLLVILLVVGSFADLLLAVMALAAAWLASALAGFCLQHQALRRAEALLRGRSIEDVVRNKA